MVPNNQPACYKDNHMYAHKFTQHTHPSHNTHSADHTPQAIGVRLTYYKKVQTKWPPFSNTIVKLVFYENVVFEFKLR